MYLKKNTEFCKGHSLLKSYDLAIEMNIGLGCTKPLRIYRNLLKFDRVH